MAKQIWKPGNMIYPLPAVMVSVTDGEGNDNIITVAWTGTVCTNPAMAYISVRPSRYSYGMLKKTGEFVINLTTEKLAFATDFCGVRSGRDRQLSVARPREAKGNRTYYLLKRSPSVINIVECGFLTNPEEAQLLKKEEYQTKIAMSVADGIDTYLASQEEHEKN